LRLVSWCVRPSRTVFPDVNPIVLANPADRRTLLTKLHTYVESFAAEQSGYYMRGRLAHAAVSLCIRFFSLLFLFLGGLCPLLPRDVPALPAIDFQPWGYLLIGIGGGLMLFDRLFGISASWMRFISASLEIEALLDEFRMRWLRAQLEAEEPQSPDTFQALIAAAADAIEGIHALALLETRAWRAEFQSGIAAQVGLGKSHTDPQASTVHSGRDRLHAMSRRS
jgi:hypothetical protein